MAKKMRAAVLEPSTSILKILEDVEIIEPRVGEVRVQIKHCGVCHSDLSCVNGTFPMEEPIVLGHEASGIVESVGVGVTHLQPGDHVILTPAPPCGRCYYCQRGNHSLCVNSVSLSTAALPDGETGLSRQGKKVLRGVGVAAFAEYAVMPACGAIKIDDDLPLDVVCVIGCALQTGVGAVLNTAKVEEGATVLITGLGGVGQSAVQGARLAGASRIIVSDPIAERREVARHFGASDLLDPNECNVVEQVLQLTGGVGVDYSFETAGVAALAELGIDATRLGGQITCVGAPAIDQGISIPIASMFVMSEKKLCGCLLGSCNSQYEIPRLIGLYRSGRLDLERMITQRLQLADVNQAMDDLTQGRGIRSVINI